MRPEGCLESAAMHVSTQPSQSGDLLPASGFDFRHIFAYAAGMGDERSKNALLIAASLIAAVRLAREEIKPTPRVLAAVSDSIRLAKMVLASIERNGN